MPALNEARGIGATLHDLNQKLAIAEVIVVDGGSADETISIAESYGCVVIQSEKGRGLQMNSGAAVATGDLFIFLHADTILPANVATVLQKFSNREEDCYQAGCFRLGFNKDSAILRFYAGWTKLNWHKLCFGDRVFVVQQHLFKELGGFAEIPIFEDLDFVKKKKKKTKWRYLKSSAITDARRFDKMGILNQQIRNFALWIGYLIGISPAKLIRYYAYSKE